MLRRLAALESWVAAGKMGVLRALIRDDDPAFLGGSRHGDLPDIWDDSLTSEIALALAASVPSADKTIRSAWELGAHLPEINTLLETGVIDAPKARLIAEIFQELSDESAGRAEALIVPELTEPPAKTYTQVERIATAIALLVDPHLGERRRKAAEKHGARVTMFRERAGTAGLSGRDLPTDQALAANANVSARAAQYKESGVFAKATMDQLRVAAYLDLLNRIPAEERIAHGLLTEQTPADHQAGDDAQASPGPAAEPRPGGDDCPCPECDGTCLPGDDSDPDDDPEDDSDAGDDDGPDGSGPGDNGPRRQRPPAALPVTKAPTAVTPAEGAPATAAEGVPAPAAVAAPRTGPTAGPAAMASQRAPASDRAQHRPRLDRTAWQALARSFRTSSFPWPRSSAWPTGPARDTASAPSTQNCAGLSPPRQPPVQKPPSASPSPTPTASPSATAAPNPGGEPPRPKAVRPHRWSHFPPGST